MTDTTAAATNASAVIPPPPRFTGNQQADMQAMIDWLWDFYEAGVVESGLLNPEAQATPEPWDPNNLPDPTNTTLATAQQAANLAYRFANLINNTLTHPVTPPTP